MFLLLALTGSLLAGVGEAMIPLAASDPELRQLAVDMRNADTEKPSYCDTYIDFQIKFDVNNITHAANK